MQSKKIKIAIVWANPYNKNLGVGALAYSSISLLYDVAKEHKLDVEFSFFGSSLSTPDSLTINGQTILFNNIYGMDFFSLKSKIKLLLFPKRFQRKSILDFDYIFDIAEGDSFTDIYGDERFWRILNSKKFFASRNKKQILLPQTIGPFKNHRHEKEAFFVMNQLNMVISRDKQSYDYTSKFIPKEKITESIDVAFYMPFEKKQLGDERINVGINVSGLLWNGGYTGNNQFDMKTNYKKLIRETLAYFTSMEDVQVHLVPHVIPTDHPVEDDYIVSEELMKEFPKTILAPRFDNPIVAKSYISGLDFFSGARMHACIAAFATNVPVFPMAYSRKFNGLFSETLKYKWMGDCVNVAEDVILNSLKDAFNKRKLIKVEINEANESIIKPRIQLLKDILAENLMIR